MVLKGKVVYDFQSVEFEEDVKSIVEYQTFFQRFEEILKSLKEIADKTPNPSGKGQKQAVNNVKKEPKASPRQIRWLINLGVDEEEAKQMTTSEASDLIKELEQYANNG